MKTSSTETLGSENMAVLTLEGMKEVIVDLEVRVNNLTMLLSALAWREGGLVLTAKDLEDVPAGHFEASPRKNGQEVALHFKRDIENA